MKGRLKIKLGNKTLEISGEGADKDIIKNLAIWCSLPEKCSCGSENIGLYYKNPKGNDYYGLKCQDCMAEFIIHQFRDKSGFYIKAEDKWEIWQSNESGASEKAPETQAAEDDTIPF